MLEVINKIKLVGLDFEFRVFGDNENPLFLANEVAKAIEHTHITKMLEIVGGKDACTSGTFIDSIGRKQEMKLLTEKQVYRILMRSDKPIAMEIQDGIFEFLKAWRKGEVKVVDVRVQLLADLFSDDKMTVVRAHKELVNMETKPLFEKIEQDKPKVQYHDTVLNPDGLITISCIAKDLGMSAIKLNKILHDMKIIYKQNGVWLLYASHQDKVPTYADYKITEYRQQLKWTELGRKWIMSLINK